MDLTELHKLEDLFQQKTRESSQAVAQAKESNSRCLHLGRAEAYRNAAAAVHGTIQKLRGEN